MQGAALVDGVSQNDSVAESRKQPVLDRLGNNIGTLSEVINVAGNVIGPEECAVFQNQYGEADHIREMEGLDLPLTDINVTVMQTVADILELFNVSIGSDGVVLFDHCLIHLP